MKKLACFIVFTILLGFFASTLTFPSEKVKVGTIHDDIELTLDSKLQAANQNLAAAYEKDKVFVSEEFHSEFSFNFVSLEWYQKIPNDTSAEISMRTLSKDGWTKWTSLEADPETKGLDLQSSYSFIATNPSDAFQYKVEMHTNDSGITPYLKDITFQYLDTMEPTQKGTFEGLNYDLNRVTFNNDSLDIISRSEWGADKNYRLYDETPADIDDDWGKSSVIESELWEGEYDRELNIETTVTSDQDGKRLIWALEYPEDVDKIVIHHTATDTNLDNPEAAIRAIYYYHAVTRGWGDIGYNFIIDQYGNIYEGRYGGDGVVAGHTAGYNIGTVGIAVLGNYENQDITYEALVSLMALIKDVADTHDIDVDATSKMRERTNRNLVGHRDLDATLCPGENIYDLIPYLRSSVSSSLEIFAYSDEPEFAYATSNDWEPLYLDPEDDEEIIFKIENIGTETWNSSTYLTANLDYEAEKIINLNRVANDSVAQMNESLVKPGETASFTVTISSGLAAGFASFDLTPVFNGYKKTSNYMNLPVYAAAPDLSYEVLEVDAADRLKSGDDSEVRIEIENQGNVVWANYGDYPVHLEPYEGSLLWESSVMNEKEVEPGETATFDLILEGPQEAGYYTEYFVPAFGDLVQADINDDSFFEILVYNDSKQAEFAAKSDKTEFYPGEEAEVWVELLNTGYLDWTPSYLTVGFVKNKNISVSAYYLVETEVEPAETGKIKFTIEAPQSTGDYKVNLKPRINGRNLSPGYFYYEFSVVEGESSGYIEPEVRVALSFEGDPVITASGDFGMYVDDALIRNFDEDDKVEVVFDGDYEVKSGGFAWVFDSFPTFVPANSSVIIEIDNFENRPAWNTSLNDNRFRGSLEVREDTVINELPLESYVKGIAEVSNGDPEEKLKTMAILARTYALYYIEIDEKFPSEPYDLNDDPDVCQKYLGYGYEVRSPNMAAAVDSTEGIVVTYLGELVKTPYFNATDGTYTKSAQEVWGWTHTPYLVPVPDSLCESDAFSGHGVGLSGCGAGQAALNGSTFEEIIKYYYTGVSINHLDEL
ncbi:MAG: SpoIID/LytB domain-containing protein [Patescibacteria group bacterium]|nr:SpoIID/LytB domain-containing protein [Patescibacteria group bacterium]